MKNPAEARDGHEAGSEPCRTQGTVDQARREREKRCRGWVVGVDGMSANGLRAGSGFTVGLFG
ncbi:MAG: hypothetical protein QOK14_1722, partial [Frankiaceae bacterium]|nr:hypothetical protein [Frankiaceae bacterium]